LSHDFAMTGTSSVGEILGQRKPWERLPDAVK